MTPRLAATLGAAFVALAASAAFADEPVPTTPTPATPDDAPAPQPPPAPPPREPMVDARPAAENVYVMDGAVATGGNTRSTAEEFLVLPEGGELGGRLRTITADGGMGTGPLKLTDVALFDVDASWAFRKHYELDATLNVLAKQPSETSESVFQGGSLAVRRDVGHRTALAIGGAASPLLGMSGVAYGGSLGLMHKKRLNEIVTFSMAGGADGVVLAPTHLMVNANTPALVEAAVHGAVLVRVPNGVWGGWLGAGYALPVYHHGNDPVSGMALDPQPRLDIDIGNAVQLSDNWDLSADLVILDRGDLAAPQTRLPMLDGGFDQIQVIIGVSRRLHGKHHDRSDDDATDPVMAL